VGRGAPPRADGSSFFVDVDALRTTASHHLIGQGLAYPTYYRALVPDLRNALTAAARQARDSGLGVWASHETTTGADVTGLAAL
jgi:endonuclease YncB( thermonuclease family)